jgi:hypothetical protein
MSMLGSTTRLTITGNGGTTSTRSMVAFQASPAPTLAPKQVKMAVSAVSVLTQPEVLTLALVAHKPTSQLIKLNAVQLLMLSFLDLVNLNISFNYLKLY